MYSQIQRLGLTPQLIQIDQIVPMLNEKPNCWRLTIPTSDMTQSEELVMSMQGVIVGKDLPPLLKRSV